MGFSNKLGKVEEQKCDCNLKLKLPSLDYHEYEVENSEEAEIDPFL